MIQTKIKTFFYLLCGFNRTGDEHLVAKWKILCHHNINIKPFLMRLENVASIHQLV